MSNREIPEKDPELEPGEKPASPEIDWLIGELTEADGQRSIQRLKAVGITISRGPDPHRKKTPGTSLQTTSKSSEASEGNVSELFNADIEREEQTLEELITELMDAADKKVGARKINELQEAQEFIHGIKSCLVDVNTQSLDGSELYRIGAWAAKEITKVAKQRVRGRGPDSDVSMSPRIKKLFANFENRYANYMNKHEGR